MTTTNSIGPLHAYIKQVIRSEELIYPDVPEDLIDEPVEIEQYRSTEVRAYIDWGTDELELRGDEGGAYVFSLEGGEAEKFQLGKQYEVWFVPKE